MNDEADCYALVGQFPKVGPAGSRLLAQALTNILDNSGFVLVAS